MDNHPHCAGAPSMDLESSTKQSHAQDYSVPHPEQPLTPRAQSMDFEASTSPSCLVKEARGEEEVKDKENYDDYFDYDDDDDYEDDFVVITELHNLTKETHLKPSDNHHLKLDQNQDLVAGASSRVSSPKERQSDITESSTERTSNDFKEDAQLFENGEEINTDIPEFAKEKHLGPSDNHHLNLEQNRDLEAGASSRVSNPKERQSDITESSTDRTSNDFEEDAQLFENGEEINTEIPELGKEKHLGLSDNHHLKLDQNQDLVAGASSRVSSPKERQSDITESSTERTSNDFKEDAQLFENGEEINTDIPELAKEKHLGLSDNHHLKLDQNQDLVAGASSRVSSPKERQSDITESSTERTSNDFKEDAQLFENGEEINTDIPEFAKEKHLGPSDNHHLNLEQNRDLEAGASSRVSNPKERQSDITESSTDRTSNDFEEDAQLFENGEEINTEIPELGKEKHLGLSDNHHLKLDQNQDLVAGASSRVSSPKERQSDITESSTERTSNDFKEDAQLFENGEEINTDIPELAKEKHLGLSDNHHLKLDQNQDLVAGASSRVSSPKERQSDITESSTERTSNDFKEDAQLFENGEEINTDIPEFAKEKHLGPSDNHHLNLEQNRDLEAGASSRVSNPKERQSDITESSTDRTSNDFEEDAQLFENGEEINTEIPELAKEKHLGLSDNHHLKLDQNQDLVAGASSRVSSPKERQSDITESSTERTSNDFKEDAQLFENGEEINTDIPELAKEKHLGLSDNHHLKLDQNQDLVAGASSRVSSPKERQSDITESSTERTSNDFKEDAQLFENGEEINTDIPEFAKEKHLGPSDNHHLNLEQNRDLEAGASSRVSNPKERQSDITESSTDRTSNDFEEDAQLFENGEEINTEIPELAKEKHLGLSDNHHLKLDQNQDLVAGASSRVSSPKERQSDITESSTERTSNDFKEDAQLFENGEEINTDIPEFAKEKHLGLSDNHHLKLDQNQDLVAGASSRVSSPKERQSDITESSTERTSNDFKEDAQLFENGEEINTDIPEFAKEKHLGPSDNHHLNLEQNRDLEAGPSSQVSSSKQRLLNGMVTLKVGSQSWGNRNGKRKIPFGGDGWVVGEWKENRLIMLYSCRFTHPRTNNTVYIRNQRPGYLFTFDQHDFIARVRFDKLEEVDFDELSVVKVRENFLKKLIIIEVIRDKEIICRDDVYMQFIQLLQDKSGKTVENLECAEDIFQLSIILEEYRSSPRGSILVNIVNNTYISSDFKDTCRELINREKALGARSKDFPQVDKFQYKQVFAQLYKIYESAVKNHKASLLEKCFSSAFELFYSMDSNINALSGRMVFYISNQDINLFCDLANEMNESFSIFLRNLQNLLFHKVMKVKKHISLKKLAPLTHPIYFHLCKHIQELILEISGKTGMSVNDLLKIDDNGGMVLVKCINWPASPLNHSLEQQYRFVFKLMSHFEPVYSSKQKFKYKFKLPKRSGNRSNWSSFMDWIANDKVPDIPEERLVWMYVLDNSIAGLFLKASEEILELFHPLVEGYMCFIQETKDVNYESFRIVMYNTVRFIAQALPYLSEGASEIDRVTLTNQIASIQYAISNKQFIDFRDLVDVYNEYWKNRESLVEKIPDKFPYGKFKGDMETIRQQLYSIVNTVLSKKVKSQELINYFRSFNEFLEDLSAVEFSWFIKKSSDVTLKEVELVDIDKKSYKVLDPEKFIKQHEVIPRHYLIEIIADLLNSVNNLLGQYEWSNNDNINAASQLVLAIKKSLLYLKEQPNYVSFDTFKEESTQPFACVVENSSSYEDFIKRISIVGESFWYLRKQDEIDIKEALMLYRQGNQDITTEIADILINCYHKYLNKFSSYIQSTCDKDYADKIEFIVKEVKDQVQLIDYDEWRENFKQETLPEILAGLAAVWSIQASKDIANTGKTLKPHCIQVLCILLLLSVDKDSKGVQKRFAQVLTGQGKSLIIGLTATLFAVMGYTIRTACYSKYLATRDQEDFDNIFELFGVKDKVTYGTFEDMVCEVLKPMVNDTRQTISLGELVEDRVLNHGTEKFGQLNHGDRSKTILFIDEVDVFFSPMFYGNCYSALKLIGMPALVGIQEYIWEMACKNCERSIILNDVEELIKKRIRERNNDFIEFKRFLIKPGEYHLLKQLSNCGYVKQLYTNQSLYEEHRDIMINEAIRIANASDTDSVRNHFKINDRGMITCKDKYGFYNPDIITCYWNVFNYLRLKKRNYDHKGFSNYGYIRINSGIISYAKLPNEYPLILGVSGTLTALNSHEKRAVINSYNIHENSVMPSYFGESNLQFNIHNDFICKTTEEQWFSEVDSHANSKIASGRSVLIFFDTDIEMDKFEKNFCSKYNRLHKLDQNTEKQIKQKYINEAGITKTVTLATREMGRGVDFKSSVAVEKKGGLHVIQTFLSLDIKEETQIKGRTARKDNKGSYELIVCGTHLTNKGLLDKAETDVSYTRLNQLRKETMEKICSKHENNIKIRNDQHELTMKFFESFFKKRCSTNAAIIEQPSEDEALFGYVI